MSKLKFRKRNVLDIILTDSRPVELPKFFSLANYYNYLLDSKKMASLLEQFQNGPVVKSNNNEDIYWGACWHAAPLKYHIVKNRFEMREMSLLSPLSMIELPLFVKTYEKQLLLFSSENGFSIRKHETNDDLYYLPGAGKSGVNYQYPAEKRMEFSGGFYAIRPYKYISEFQNSNLWYQLNRDYRYFGKIDYSKCFDSIYTHTFTWLITKNSVDGKEFGRKNSYFLNICDSVLQNFNGAVTNGIVVGPEFSRLMMEIIAQYIDEGVKNKLGIDGLQVKKDYYICRYVDDIFIFADDEKLVERIIELYRDTAEAFHFRLNEKKRLVGKLPYAWFRWKEEVHSVNEYMCKTLFTEPNKTSSVLKYSPMMISNLKMLYQNLMATYPDYYDKITSYVLSTMFKRIDGEKRPLLPNEGIVERLLFFLDALFYFYAFAPTYNNTEKVISILQTLGKLMPETIFKDCLHGILCIYSLSILKANPEDIANLLLLISMYGIELPDEVEKAITSKVENADNPLLYAVLLKYYGYNSNKQKLFRKKIEKKIEQACSSMINKYRFFEYTEVWWLFIFVNCSLLSKRCRDEIKTMIDTQKDYLESNGNNHLSKEAKILVVSFLLDDSIQNKFINWDMKKEELFEYTVFTTYQRTLFNGYNAKKDLDLDYEFY